MKIEFHKVTWYSITASILVFFVGLPILCWYIWGQYIEVSSMNVRPPLTAAVLKKPVSDFSYLFKENREPMTGNIVGYFGSGAFAWYVPDWLAENWTISKASKTDENMTITPKVRQDATDFSDIVFTVRPSTETFNALGLYDQDRKSVLASTLIINEVLLNKPTEGETTIVMENDTRIYHIQETMADRIRDVYYIDGNGKTLVINFDAKATVYPQFSTKIRNMVEGIGELIAPQG